MNNEFIGWTLKRMSLLNWGGFIKDDFDLVSDNVLITAPNGTGKTALFDAYSICISGGKNTEIDNTEGKDKRTIQGYILGAYQGGKIREQAVSYISLLFKKHHSQDSIAVVLRLASREGDTSNELNSMIILNKDIKTDNFLKDNKPMDWDTFRDSLQINPKPKTYTENSKSDFRKELFSLFSPINKPIAFTHYQKLLNMMKNGVKGDFNIENFIRKFIVEDDHINFGTVRDDIKDMKRNMEQTICFYEFSKKIISLEDIHNNYKKECISLDVAEKNYQHYNNIIRLKNIFESEIKKDKLLIEQLKQKEYIQELKDRLEQLISENALLKNNDISINIKQLELDIKNHEQIINKVKNEIIEVQQILDRDSKILQLIDLEYQTTTTEDIESKKDEIRDYLIENKNCIKNEIKTLEDILEDIKQLESGRQSMSIARKKADNFSEICQNKNIKVAPLYTLIDSVDKGYNLALETFMGNMRFTIIPETMNDYNQAKNLLSDPSLIIALPCKDDGAKDNSMAKHIHTTHNMAKSYLNYKLGRIMEMNGEDKEGDNTLSLKIDSHGMINRFQGRELKKMMPLANKDLILGQMTKEERANRIQTLKSEQQNKETIIATLNNDYINANNIMENLIKITLDLPSVSNMQDKIKNEEDKIKQCQDDIIRLNADTDIQEKIKNNEEIIRKNKIEILTQENNLQKISENIGNETTKLTSLKTEFVNSDIVLLDTNRNNDDFMKNYYEEHKNITISINDIDKMKKAIDKMKKDKISIARNINQFCQENNSYDNLQEIGGRINTATFSGDEYLDKELSNVWKQKNMQNRELLQEYALLIPQLETNMQNLLKDQYFNKVKEMIDSLSRNIRNINRKINNIVLHDATYSFSFTPRNERKKWVDTINSTCGIGEFSEDEKDIVNQISNIMQNGDNDEVLNPLNWFNYDIKVTTKGQTMPLAKWKGGGSGGMKAVPGYVALLGAMSNTVFFPRSNEAGPVVLFIDEAMEHIDSDNSSGIVDMYKQGGLQTIYLTNSSNFPSESVSQVIRMKARDNKTVKVHNTYVHEAVKEIAKKTKTTYLQDNLL